MSMQTFNSLSMDISRQHLLRLLLMVVGCLTSQQHASVFRGQICVDNCTYCHIEIEVADQTCHLTQSQYRLHYK